MAVKKSSRQIAAATGSDNTEKDPETWTTGDEPMTGAQKSYLKTLSEEAGKKPETKLTKAEASERIESLKDGQHVVDARGKNPDGDSNQEKDPKTWATGGEPMTGAQKSYLKTLSEEAGVEFEASLTKGEASMRIDALRKRNPRTKSAPQ